MKRLLLSLLILLYAVNFSEAQEKKFQYQYKFRNPELDIEKRLDDLMIHLTLDEKISMLSETAPEIRRLGMDGVNHGNEALHGIVRPGKFTVFPRPLGLAATFNPEAIELMGDYISDESRARYNENDHKNVGEAYGGKYNGLLTFWSPTVNMARDPRWGRTGETYGEDPFLTGKMGAAFTRGLQGDGKYLKAIATPKHFVGNNQETGRFGYNASIPLRSLHEYYLQGFKACVVEGKAFSIMAAYNAINGVPCSVNPYILKDVLRDDWGFEGYVVGDLYSPSYTFSYHHYTNSPAHTAAECIKNGLELDSGFSPFRHLREAIQKGYCTEADVEQAVRKVLRGRFKLGMFDPEELVPHNKISPDVIGCEKHQQLALELAQQSIVMLKNENKTLPFGKNIKKIGLLGSCIDTYKHKQYSCTEGSFTTPITPSMGIQAICKERGIELIEIPWEEVSGQEQYVSIKTEFLKPSESVAGKNNGLTGKYFNTSLNSDQIRGKRVDEMIDFNREQKAPDEMIIIQPLYATWSGKIIPPVTGNYKFMVEFNGDIELNIGGKVVTATENGSNQNRKIEIALTSGKEVDVKINYADTKNNALCALKWIIPESGTRQQKLQQLADCDAVVMVMGLSNQSTGEGSDKLDLNLPQDQTKLMKEVYNINKNITLVLMNSTVLDLNWEDRTFPAILEAWYPGEKCGQALTDILWGEVNPSGRLPMTFCRSVYDLPSFANYDITAGRTYMYNKKIPLYEFGFGLSYTTFDYSNLKLDKNSYKDDETISVSFNLKNSGDYDGDEVSQIYIRPVNVDVPVGYILPKKQLKGFKRTTLKRGENTTVNIEIPVSSIFYFDEDKMKERVYHGELELQLGASSTDIRLTHRFNTSE